MNHFSHPQHKLSLVNSDHVDFICDGCKEGGMGSRYYCSECDFDLHTHCAVAKPDAAPLRHTFYPKSLFNFHTRPPGKAGRYCDACGNDVTGFVYHCPKSGYDLHPCCAALPHERQLDGVHRLRLHPKASKPCNWCNKRGKGWCYRSDSDDYNLHVACAMRMALDMHKLLKKEGRHALSAGGGGEGGGDHGKGGGNDCGRGDGGGHGGSLSDRNVDKGRGHGDGGDRGKGGGNCGRGDGEGHGRSLSNGNDKVAKGRGHGDGGDRGKGGGNGGRGGRSNDGGRGRGNEGEGISSISKKSLVVAAAVATKEVVPAVVAAVGRSHGLGVHGGGVRKATVSGKPNAIIRTDHKNWKVKMKKWCELAGMMAHFVIAAVLGDPSSLIIAFVSAFLSQ